MCRQFIKACKHGSGHQGLYPPNTITSDAVTCTVNYVCTNYWEKAYLKDRLFLL